MSRVLSSLLFSAIPLQIDAHAYLANPVSRGVLFSTTPHGLGAVGPKTYINTCGMTANGFANDIVGNVPKNANHYQDTRDCISTLKLDSIFRAHVRIKAHHIGHMELRLCTRRLDGHQETITDCSLLERATSSEVPNVDCSNHSHYGTDDVCLPRDETNPGYWYVSPCADHGRLGAGAMGEWCEKFMYFKMPTNLVETDTATLQWYYKTGNSCVPGPNAQAECEYVKARNPTENPSDKIQDPNAWCAAQWPCVHCQDLGAGGQDDQCYDFSTNKGGWTNEGGEHRSCCSEVFTTCADVKLSNSKGGTSGPKGVKNAFEGNGAKWGRIDHCDNALMNVVYSDDVTPYSKTSGGGGDDPKQFCRDAGIKCYVAEWAEPCAQWSQSESACEGQGGEWLPNSSPQPESEPETDPVTTTPVTTTPPAQVTAAPRPRPEPKPATTPPPPVTAAPQPTPPSGETSSGCKAKKPDQGGITDATCQPCLTGQSWWPCNTGRCLGCEKKQGGLLLELSDTFDPLQCQWTSISDRASDKWCSQNCAASGLHPACNPETDNAHKHCVCNKIPTDLLEVPATKFSGSVKSKAKFTRHANIDAAGHLRIDP